MDLRQITYFCKIAEAGSFSAAARELNVAQPALSHHIGKLEEELGIQLLLRSIRGTELTEPGKTLYEHGKKILAQVRAAREDVLQEASVPKGVVALVLPPMLGRHVGPQLVRRVRATLPEVQLELREALGLRAHEMVRTGRCDIGVVATAGPPDLPGSELFYREHLYFTRAADADNPPRPVGSVSLDEALSHPLVMSRERHGVRAIVEAVARVKHLTLDIALETESSRLLIAYITQGLATGILPWPSIFEQLDAGAIVADRIEEENLVRQVSLLWTPGQQPTMGTRAVAEELRATIAECRAAGVIRGG
ncbi:LysR family transcriptional regulator [Pseudooceanicola sp.]|jgi:LysR family nitrogen assimilation transcriptional regulator|uniref:LysR family transcriptional regulator n=1 Tax=Pseudooceanicola sp. TaxID=1914328 RepID=UPI0040581E3B